VKELETGFGCDLIIVFLKLVGAGAAIFIYNNLLLLLHFIPHWSKRHCARAHWLSQIISFSFCMTDIAAQS